MKRLLAALMSIVILAGCAARGDFPSLAKRSFEQADRNGSAPATPPPAPQLPSDPALLARVAQSLDRARASIAPFAEQLAKSRPQIDAAVGAPPGSEAWIAGQVATSRLEPLLVPAATAATAIAEAYRELMLKPPSPDRATLEAALAEATAIADRQAQQVAELAAKLNR